MLDHKTISPAVTGSDTGVSLRVKVVPGASRSRVVRMLGDRLKLSVAAPPEAGKANQAVCALIGKLLDIPARDVVVASGTTNPQKTLAITGLTRQVVIDRLCRLDIQ